MTATTNSTRRTKGSGSITEAKDKSGAIRKGYYNVQVSGKDANGDRIRITRTVKGKRAAEAKLRELTSELLEGVRVEEQSRLTFGPYAREWHDMRVSEGKLAKSSLTREAQTIRLICTYWEGKKIADIRPKDIQRLYVRIKDDKVAARGSFSGGSMLKIHVTLNQILEDATLNDYIARNPCRRVARPKTEKAERKSLTPIQCQMLINRLDADEAREVQAFQEKEQRKMQRGADAKTIREVYGLSRLSKLMAVRIGLATGMRRGEIMGLDWGHVELSADAKGALHGVIKVRQSLTREGDIKEPKTSAGIRNITLDGSTAAKLAWWRDFQAAVLPQLGERLTAGTPVCCTDVGGYFDLTNFTAWWVHWRDENGFKGLKFHELRHTQASLLLANGVDIKTVQKRGGWASTSMLLDVYAHAMEENDKGAALILEQAFYSSDSSTADSPEYQILAG